MMVGPAVNLAVLQNAGGERGGGVGSAAQGIRVAVVQPLALGLLSMLARWPWSSIG